MLVNATQFVYGSTYDHATVLYPDMVCCVSML